MKRKNWKRTAAFVTSLTMATTMMPAELGSVLVKAVEDPNKAPEIATLDWATTKYDTNSKSFITKIKVNDVEQTNIISNRDMEFAAGSKVEITSKVPLKFTYNNKNHDDNDVDGENTFKLAYGAYGITKTGDQFKKDGENISEQAAIAAILTAAGYDVTDETFTGAWDRTKDNVVVTFAAKETKNSNGSYTYLFTMPDDNAPLVEDTDTQEWSGTSDSVTVGIYSEPIKVNFYESDAERTADQQAGGGHLWTRDETKGTCLTYFTGLRIDTSKNDVADAYTTAGAWNLDAKTITVGDTVTVTSENPFKVLVSDGNNNNNWTTGTYTYDTKLNKYKSEFTMPKLADGADPDKVIIDVVKIDEDYQYTLSGDKLIANSKNTEAIRNVQAAGIVAKYYVGDGTHSAADLAAAANFDNPADPGKEITGAVPNGAVVVVKAGRATKLTNADVNTGSSKAFTVTKNGSAIAGNNSDGNGTVVSADNASSFVGEGKAGTYKATYKVTGKDGQTYSLEYSFRVASKDELTAENVRLNLTAKKDNAVTDITAVMPNEETHKNGLGDGKIVNFMLSKDKEDEVTAANYQFTVDPKVIVDALDNELEADKYSVVGYTSGSSLNTTYEFTIKITDPEYGGSVQNPKKINIKWRVVGYDEIPHWNNNRFGLNGTEPVTGSGTNGDASISIDMMGENSIGLKEEIFKAAGANGAACDKLEAGEVDFQYIKAPGADRTFEKQDELDEFKDGLPSELGDYTVYVVYDDTVQATVDVHITKYSLGIYADASDLTFKYGHKFELTKPVVQKDVNGDAVDVEISDLKCYIYRAVKELDDNGAETGRYIKDAILREVNKNVDGRGNPLPVAIDAVGQLNAGHYFVEFTGVSADEDYSVNSEAQEITVNQKPLNDPSLVILIDPFNYDGATHDVVKERAVNFTVRDTDFDETDSRYDVSDIFKITEGGKQSDVKSYDCSFKLVNEGAVNLASKIEEADRLLALVYNGEVREEGANPGDNPVQVAYNANNAKADVSKSDAVNVAEAVFDLANDLTDDFAEAYKWAVRKNYISKGCVERANTKMAEVVENITTELNNATNATGADANVNATKAAAHAAYYLADVLADAKLANGTGNNVDAHANEAYNESKNEPLKNYVGSTMAGKWHIIAPEADPAKVKAGLAWTDSKTTLYDNGKIHLEITRNADDKINTDKSVADIAKFGVIVDKEGKLEAPLKYGVKYNNTYIGTIADATEKAAAESEKATAEKFLTLGNGFTEGGYTKTTTPLTCKEQTYKVNIKVKDIDTGIWARPYIQYEDGTVSYGEVKYLDLTNEAVTRLQLETAPVAASGKAVRKADLDKYATATPALIMANVKSGYNTAENKFYVYTRYVDLQKAGFTNVAEVADFGIVADRSGAIDAPAADVATPEEIASVKNTLKVGNGFVEGHYNKNNTVLGVNEYAASVNIGNSDTGLWVRSYIDLGNGLVIYNDPMYIKSASEYYGVGCAGTLKTEWEKKDANNYARLVFTQNELAPSRITTATTGFAAKAGIDAKNIEVVKTGVVADKNNLLNKPNKMVLGSDFIDGVHKGDIKTETYSAKLTPKETNDVSVRTYTTYKIKGEKKDVEVTVYGPVTTYKYSVDSKRVVKVLGPENDDGTDDTQIDLQP